DLPVEQRRAGEPSALGQHGGAAGGAVGRPDPWRIAAGGGGVEEETAAGGEEPVGPVGLLGEHPGAGGGAVGNEERGLPITGDRGEDELAPQGGLLVRTRRGGTAAEAPHLAGD